MQRAQESAKSKYGDIRRKSIRFVGRTVYTKKHCGWNSNRIQSIHFGFQIQNLPGDAAKPEPFFVSDSRICV